MAAVAVASSPASSGFLFLRIKCVMSMAGLVESPLVAGVLDAEDDDPAGSWNPALVDGSPSVKKVMRLIHW